MTWLLVVPLLSLLVLVHEIGHFAVARLFRITVHEFGIGFPPRVASICRGGVLYSLNLIPIGGFVRFAEDGADSFHARPTWQRAAVLFAGPGANFLLAAAIFTTLALTGGLPQPRVRIADVVPSSPAAVAGLAPNDIVLAVDGVPVDQPDAVRQVVQRSDQPTVVVTVADSAGNVRQAVVEPTGERRQLGVQLGVASEPRTYEPGAAVAAGIQRAVAGSVGTVEGLASTVRDRSIDAVQGPIGMARDTGWLVDRLAERGGLAAVAMGFAHLAAGLSLGLFIFNLLPVPVLDGGRLLLLAIEAVRRRRLTPEVEASVQLASAVCLLVLFIAVSASDVARLFPRG
ncbi:MAG: site-2 protease family protein [Chloroflexi bacterium]|nr:site-2 protease family protein [Chloroflexota bacterium]